MIEICYFCACGHVFIFYVTSGWLYEVTGSYTLPILLAGAFLILSAIVILVVDLRIRYQRRRQELSLVVGEDTEASCTKKFVEVRRIALL